MTSPQSTSTTPLKFPPNATDILNSSNSNTPTTQSLINDLFYTLKFYPTPLHFFEQVHSSCTMPHFLLFHTLDTEQDNLKMREKALYRYKYCVLSQMVPQVSGRKAMRKCMVKNLGSRDQNVAEHKCKPLIDAFEKKYNLIVTEGLIDEKTRDILGTMHNDAKLRQDMAFETRCNGMLEMMRIQNTTKVLSTRPKWHDERVDVQYIDTPTAKGDPIGVQEEVSPEEWQDHLKDRCGMIQKRILKRIEKHLGGMLSVPDAGAATEMSADTAAYLAAVSEEKAAARGPYADKSKAASLEAISKALNPEPKSSSDSVQDRRKSSTLDGGVEVHEKDAKTLKLEKWYYMLQHTFAMRQGSVDESSGDAAKAESI